MADYSYHPTAPQDTGYPLPVANPRVDLPAQDTNYSPTNYQPPPVADPRYAGSTSQFDQTYPMPQETTPLTHGYAPNKASRQPPARVTERGRQARHAHNRRPTYSACNPSSQAPPNQYQPAPPVMQSQTTNVVVVNNQPQAARVHQQVVVTERRHFNHLVHLLLTILFPPWVFIWLLCCAIHGC